MHEINMCDQRLLEMHELSQCPTLLQPISRRRLPQTPSRRSSSPRILPPPPLSPESITVSSILDRRPSGRKLPLPPHVDENFESSVAFSPSSVHRKFSEFTQDIAITNSVSQLQHRSNSFEHSLITTIALSSPKPTGDDTNGAAAMPFANRLRSRYSSQTIDDQSIRRSSGSDAEELAAHGLDISLYQNEASTSSSSVRDASISAMITRTSPTSIPQPEAHTHPLGLGYLHCSLQHFPVRKRLRISLLKAEGLAGQLKPELEIHAYCKLQLLPGGKMQSSIVKRGRDIAYNQEFFFDNIASDALLEKCLKITVCHQPTQKLQKYIIIGEMFLPLRNLPELQAKKEVRVIEELEHHMDRKKLGRILLSCCVENAARRLTINIIKADDLQKGGITGAPDVCVRICLNQCGKDQVKQSRVIKGTCCAVYKEAVMFLVSPKVNDLRDASITITVHDLSRTITGDDIIGMAFLGKVAVDKSEIEQWKNVIEHQGKEYKATHALKPSQRTPDVHITETPSDIE